MKVINEEAPGAVKEYAGPEGYTGRVVAIDASMSLYQFLIAIRGHGREGGPATVLTNADGEQTSHIQGMFNRTIRLLEAGVKPVYVFDGKPPEAKDGTLADRAQKRAEAEKKLKEATAAGDNAAIEKRAAARGPFSTPPPFRRFRGDADAWIVRGALAATPTPG